MGIGGRIGYTVNERVALEMVVNSFFPDSRIADGWESQWLWGAKVGRRFTRVGFFTKARIGLLSFTKDLLTSADGAVPVARLDPGNFTADVGGILEIHPPERNRLLCALRRW